MYSQQLPSGKVRYYETYIDPMTMVRKTTSVTMQKDTARTRKTAQEALRLKISRLSNISKADSKTSLAELLRAYEDGIQGTVRPQTANRNIGTLKKTIAMLGEDVQVNKLTARYVVDKFSKWDAKAVSKNERLARFKTFIRWGYKMEYVSNIDWLSKLPKYEDDRKGRRDLKYLEKEEAEALINAMSVSYHRNITRFGLLTGMRIGEILGLKSSNVDMDGRVIHVVETKSCQTGEDGPTKTDGSTRDVYIQKELMELLGEIQQGKVYFFEHNGRYVEYAAYNKYLEEVSEKVIGKRVSSHYLRHTHTSLLAAQGVDLQTISRRLGHSSSDMTRTIYLHVTKEMRNHDEAILNAINLL